jgi:plastocyanin
LQVFGGSQRRRTDQFKIWSAFMSASFARLSAFALGTVSLGLAVAALASPVLAADEMEMTISIKDHKFEPTELKVPAGKAVKLTVNNLDATAEEFESHPLKFEKVIPGKQSAVIRLKPMTKGTYKFFGEYHEDTAQGAVVVE